MEDNRDRFQCQLDLQPGLLNVDSLLCLSTDSKTHTKEPLYTDKAVVGAGGVLKGFFCYIS